MNKRGKLIGKVIWNSSFCGCIWPKQHLEVCLSLGNVFTDLQLMGTHCWDTFEARANLIFRFVWADLLRFQRVFDCLENKDDPLSTSWKLSKIPQLLPPFFFLSPAERTRQRLHLHGDCSGKQLHCAPERQVRGLVHGFHTQGAPEEGLQDQAAPEGGPLHEAPTQGALAEREETVWCPSSRRPRAPCEQAD